MFSQSQLSQRQHEQIPLGQRSDNEEEDGREEGEEEPTGRTVLSAAPGGRESGDRTKEEGCLAARASTGMKTDSRKSPGDLDGSCFRRKRDGRDVAIIRGRSTQQVARLRTFDSANKGGGGVDGVGGEGGKVDGGGGTRRSQTPALHADEGIANGMTLAGGGGGGGEGGGDAARQGAAIGAALPPSDVAERPGHSRDTTQPAPSGETARRNPSVVDERGTAVGVGAARLGGDGAPSITPPSIWADLDGLASGDDSTSDDDQGAARSRPAAPESSTAPFPPQGPALSNFDPVNGAGAAAGKTDQGATAIIGEAESNAVESGEAPQQVSAGASQASGRAEQEPAAPGSAGFSLLDRAGGGLGDDDLLDAALEDSD